MGAVTQDKLPAFFRGSHQYIRIVLSYEIGPVAVLFADYNPFWLFKHRAEQGAYSGRSGSDDENCVIFVYLRYFGGPIACGKNVSDKNRLLVAYGIRNDAQSQDGTARRTVFILLRILLHPAVSLKQHLSIVSVIAESLHAGMTKLITSSSNHCLADGSVSPRNVLNPPCLFSLTALTTIEEHPEPNRSDTVSGSFLS